MSRQLGRDVRVELTKVGPLGRKKERWGRFWALDMDADVKVTMDGKTVSLVGVPQTLVPQATLDPDNNAELRELLLPAALPLMEVALAGHTTINASVMPAASPRKRPLSARAYPGFGRRPPRWPAEPRASPVPSSEFLVDLLGGRGPRAASVLSMVTSVFPVGAISRSRIRPEAESRLVLVRNHSPAGAGSYQPQNPFLKSHITDRVRGDAPALPQTPERRT
jgi:hypothetical protein